MAQQQEGESLHQTKLGWWVWSETGLNNLKMMGKSAVLLSGAVAAAIIVAAFITTQIGLYHPHFALSFYWDFVKLSGQAILHDSDRALWKKSFDAILSDLFLMILYHSVFGILTGYFLFKKVSGNSEEMSKTKFISGTPLISEDKRIAEIKRMLANGLVSGRFRIGRILLPLLAEVNSVLIMAASGGGKGVLLSMVMRKAGSLKNIKGICFDKKPEWTLSCYRPERGDLIFNPLDQRSLKWRVFNDIEDIMDLKNFAKWIVPDQPGAKDAFWQLSARGILESILLKLWEDGATTNADIRRAINLPAEKLAQFLEGYSGAEYAMKKDSLSTLKTQMQWVDFLPDGDFSIRKWMNEADRGLIFLSATEKTEALFAPALTLFVNAVGSHLLSLPDDRERRFFFFLDEFTALGKLDKIIDLLKLGRSKGSSVWLAFQDMQAAQKIYSQDDFATIVNNCKNIAIGQTIEPKAALYFSQKFGKQIFYETSTTLSAGVGENRDGFSLQQQRKEDFVVKDTDLINLKEREFFVKINGYEGVTKTTADIIEMPKIAEGFIPLKLTKEEQIAMVRAQKTGPAKKEVLTNEEMIEDLKGDHGYSAIDENELGY